jgi:hypothetical protein
MVIFVVQTSYAQSGVELRGDNNQFWTLPPTECDGDNFCEVRISPQGTIYGWNNIHRKLYISQGNQGIYLILDLSNYATQLGFNTDFIPFDSEGYIIFFTSFGGLANHIMRYSINTGTLEEVIFPSGYRLVGCNPNTAVEQRTLRFIFQLGSVGRFMACTDSPQDNPIIHIINVDTLAIEQSLNINARFIDVTQPLWIVAGGLDNKIYAIVRNPNDTIPNLPQIDEATQEIILVYDVTNQIWSYEIKPKENTYEVLAVLPNNEGIFFQNGSEIIQFDTNFQIVRRIPSPGRFQGMTANGDIFFSIGGDYADISVSNVRDYPVQTSYLSNNQ